MMTVRGQRCRNTHVWIANISIAFLTSAALLDVNNAGFGHWEESEVVRT